MPLLPQRRKIALLVLVLSILSSVADSANDGGSTVDAEVRPVLLELEKTYKNSGAKAAITFAEGKGIIITDSLMIKVEAYVNKDIELDEMKQVLESKGCRVESLSIRSLYLDVPLGMLSTIAKVSGIVTIVEVRPFVNFSSDLKE